MSSPLCGFCRLRGRPTGSVLYGGRGTQSRCWCAPSCPPANARRAALLSRGPCWPSACRGQTRAHVTLMACDQCSEGDPRGRPGQRLRRFGAPAGGQLQPSDPTSLECPLLSSPSRPPSLSLRLLPALLRGLENAYFLPSLMPPPLLSNCPSHSPCRLIVHAPSALQSAGPWPLAQFIP